MSGGQGSVVTGLLRAWGKGDLRARDDLLPRVYRELRINLVTNWHAALEGRATLSSNRAPR
jgi:hypothetical protein